MSLSRSMQYSANRTLRFIQLWKEQRKLDRALAARKAARQQFNSSRKRDREGRFAS